MSAYHSYETVFKDKDCLVEALKEMGFKPSVHDEAKQLTGYQGDKRQQTAEIIIPKAQVGSASNDIGFKKEGDVYKAIISAYDGGKYNKNWQNKLK